MNDLKSGEEVNYTYDSLTRLSTASTTGPTWGQSFVYDGWGNRTDQLVTKGSAPVISVSVDPATNRITSSGYTYDGAGNLTKMPKGAGSMDLAYDVENRLWRAGKDTPQFVDRGAVRLCAGQPAGLPQHHRQPGRRCMFWLGGQMLVEWRLAVDGNGYWSGFWAYPSSQNVYFGGRRVGELNDRLGSEVTSGKSYYPYGQEKTVTADGTYKFATYFRDSWTGLDYADQRFYASGLGRFLTADPYVASAGVGDPGSWNRYA